MHLVTSPECTTLKSSIIVNTCQIGSTCQSNKASSVPNNPWVLSIVVIMCVSTLGHVDNIESILCEFETEMNLNHI
jgi:hypothetical protein